MNVAAGGSVALLVGLVSIAVIGIGLGLSLVFYVLWKSSFGLVVAKMGTDVLRYGISSAIVGAVCSMAAAKVARKPVLVAFCCFGLSIALAIACLHGNGVACTSKKTGVCEPLWSDVY